MIDDDTRQVRIKSWHGPLDDRRMRSRARFPALTILYHPDSRRVGERVLLHELAGGTKADLSRNRPKFEVPGSGERGRGLEDLYLSRKPIRLVHDAFDDRIRLIATRSPTRLTVDGIRVAKELTITGDQLERGVVIELGRRVVLLLHSRADVPAETGDRFGLIGDSDAMSQLFEEIRTVAELDLPVLLCGETGSGKELVARAIHGAGELRDQAFLGVNMGAITPSLAASELFGAVKGAFTGAVRGHVGYFQRAHGGTLFLDEIGETPSEVQVMLLRVLETGEVQRVGGERPRQVDVRLIAATDTDLTEAIDEGRFREPLLHRLSGYEIRIPPLRERRDDVGRLLFHFLREELRAISEEHRLDPPSGDTRPGEIRPWMPMSIVARLALYDWPGNVRQLRNVARQLVVSSRGADTVQVPAPVERLLIDAVKAPPGIREIPADDRAAPPQEPPKTAFRKPSEVTEKELTEALESNRWELKPTAATLRISRGSLYNLIERSKRLRKAGDLSRTEIVTCYEHCGGDLEKMVDRLEISKSGLQMRMKALGVE